MLHPVEDVPGMSFLGSLEQEVFHEVRHALFLFGFIAGAGIDGKATISYCRLVGSMDNA
jgi:hypothetical protein